jgi:hypothetical protein
MEDAVRIKSNWMKHRFEGADKKQECEGFRPTSFSKRLFNLIVGCMPVDRECLVEVNLTRCHLNIVAPGPPWWPGSRLYGLGGRGRSTKSFWVSPKW